MVSLFFSSKLAIDKCQCLHNRLKYFQTICLYVMNTEKAIINCGDVKKQEQ